MPVARPAQPWSLNTSSPQYTGLLGYWPGQAAGGLVDDFIGASDLTYAKDTDLTALTLNVQAMPVIGGDSALLAFNDTDRPCLFNSTAIIPTTASFTISGWVNVPGNGGLQRSLFTQGLLGEFGVLILRTTGNLVNFVIQSDTGAISNAQSVGTLVDNTTTLVTCVCAMGSTVKVYINGSPDGSSATAITTLKTGSGFGFPATRRGASGDLTPGGYFADLRIYNRAMSDADVLAMYTEATRWDLLTVSSPATTRNRVSCVL